MALISLFSLIFVWMELEVKKLAQLQGHAGSIYSLSQGGTAGLFFSAGGDQRVIQWNLEKMAPEKVIAQLPAVTYSISYVKELELLFVGTATGSIHIIDLKSKKEIKILKHHSGPIFSIVCSLCSKLFITASADGSISICSLDTLSLLLLRTLCHGKVRSIDLNASETEFAVAAADGNIRIFDLETFEEKKCFYGHEQSANVVKYHSNGTSLLSGGRDAYLKSWDIKTNFRLQQAIPAHNFAIYSFAFSPDNALFATASRDKTIKLWDSDLNFLLRINKEKHEGHLNSVNTLLWTTYNNYLISAGDDRAVIVWEVKIKP